MEQTDTEIQKNEIKVSVLVAVYNGEAFLPVCLDSLRQQELKAIEVICVDDCSTDGSLEILKKYASEDPRIKVLHLEENRGQAYARNEALKVARGEYVCMLDCDDWMSADALKEAVGVFERNAKADCVLFSLIFHYSDSGREWEFPLATNKAQSGRDAFLKALTWDGIHGVYMIRRELHTKYPYDDAAYLYSDDNTTAIHFLCSREVDVCKGRYYYLQHPASMTHAVSSRRFLRMKAMQSLKEQVMSMGEDGDVIDILENQLWLIVVDSYMFYYNNRPQLSPADRQWGLSEIRRVWQEVDTTKLQDVNCRKFGYIPFRNSWMLFRCQEELYFFLKKIKEKICK